MVFFLFQVVKNIHYFNKKIFSNKKFFIIIVVGCTETGG